MKSHDKLKRQKIRELEGMLEVIHSLTNVPLIKDTEKHDEIQNKRIDCQVQYKKLTGHYYKPTGNWYEYLINF